MLKWYCWVYQLWFKHSKVQESFCNMCKDKTNHTAMNSEIKDAVDVESKERLMQAKRLWNLRWCYNWYNRKCELEEKMYRRRHVNHEDMLLTTNLNLCVIQQVLKINSNDSSISSDDLFGISESEQEVAEDITAVSSPASGKPPAEKMKYKLLKTPLHYMRVLKNKVSRNQNKYGNKATLNKDKGEFPPLSSVKKSFEEEYEQRCGVPSRFDMSCDLIDFVSSRRGSNKCGLLALQCPACHIQQVIKSMGLKLRSPLNPEDNDGPSHLLRAEWKEPTAGEKVVYIGDVSTSETFPRATALQLLEESAHSSLCVYYIVRSIVRSVITSHAFNFLKNCKKRKAIENNLTTILRNAQDNHFLMSSGWRKELHSSPSCPVQLHSYMTTNVPYGVDKKFTSSYARGKYGDSRQKGGMPDEFSLPWRIREHVTAEASPRPSEYPMAHPHPYYARGSYAAGLAHDPEKSKTL